MRFAFVLCVAAGVCLAQEPVFTAAGELVRPADYREWVYLSSGLGMTYGPNAATALNAPMFDNVYVTPSAFRAFKQTGQWPDKTMFVLEIRYSTSQGSINKGGFYQTDLAALEVAVKDEKRYPATKWAYFNFSGGLRPLRDSVAPMGPNASCQTCHSTNGAVENTFTQFYPLALEIAQAKGTVKPTYLPPVDSPAKLLETLKTKGWPHAESVLTAAREKDPKAMIAREATLKTMADALAAQQRGGDALSLFKFIAASFPESATARDSLAGAYEQAGDTRQALAESRKGLALLDAAELPADRKELIRKALADRIAKLSR